MLKQAQLGLIYNHNRFILKINKVKEKMKKGFTFVEITVVIVLIGIISGVGYYGYNKFIERTKVSKITKDVRRYQEVIQSRVLQLKKGEKLKAEGTDFSGYKDLKRFVELEDIDVKNTNYFVKNASGLIRNDMSMVLVEKYNEPKMVLAMAYSIGKTNDCILKDALSLCPGKTGFADDYSAGCQRVFSYDDFIQIPNGQNMCFVELVKNYDSVIEFK